MVVATATAVRGPALRASMVVTLLLMSCADGGERRKDSPPPPDTAATQTACPAKGVAPALLPGMAPEHGTLEYWLARHTQAELDAPLLDVEDIRTYNENIGRRPGNAVFSQRDLNVPVDPVRLAEDLSERLSFLRERLATAQYVDQDGHTPAQPALAEFEIQPPPLEPALHVAFADLPIRCGPYDGGLYKPDLNLTYDRNACSTLRAQEPVQVLTGWPNGMRLVRTRYALGWISSDAKISAALPAADARRVLVTEHLRLDQATSVALPTGGDVHLPKHTRLPVVGGSAFLGTHGSLVEITPPATGVSTARPLTRRALLSTAFSFLDSPYGFGGTDGGRDCSRLQLDVFESFGIALPRHSGWQAKAGSFSIDLKATPDESARIALIDEAAKRGAVLLYFPGHIMLYLGRDHRGVPMAIHALGEYARPCAGSPGETVLEPRRVMVTDLEVGRGSTRKAFIERLTRLVVLGREPGPALADSAMASVAAPPPLPEPDSECRDSADVRIFVSPRRPIAGKPLRVIVTGVEDPGSRELWLWDPDGNLHSGVTRRLGGPPYTQWTRAESPSPGRWTAVLGDEHGQLACERIRVRKNSDHDRPPPPTEVWTPRWAWERDTENLWSAFVEQLFDYPPEDGRTWTNLHSLLRDADRNLLHDHLGRDEDSALELVPDCADLPYVLRAYFAWKLQLPFAYRQCSRGRAGHPPTCGPMKTNLMDREANDDIKAFSAFANRKVRNGVHSATGRTHPANDNTDMYPVDLERESLPAGTVYSDPYGHVMILTRWFDQGRSGPDSYGLLMAAEAQPDGTVGRRRFWQGSFLFDPSTDDVGAGFKHFRPLLHDRELDALTPVDNRTLTDSSEFAPFSMGQYAGGKDDFYDRMDALINPDPLDPAARQASLVDALDESVRRRVIAVSNGEEFMASHGFRVVDMPVGHEIFETTGPWEDFSTPSRDMRLLISIDTVMRFPSLVNKYPQRFGLDGSDQIKRTVDGLQEQLRRSLAARTLSYTRSDGTTQSLTMADVVDRASALELAYNPNDCVEIRWGAPSGSEEAVTCKRHAPATQTRRMKRYRPWFTDRTRPGRGATAP